MRILSIKGGIEKIIRYLLVAIFFVMVISGCSYSQENRDVLFQTSTINALLEGVYEGEMTYIC